MSQEINSSGKPELSISIVSMAKPDMLIECIDSIQRHTTGITYELLVVAYLYPEGNAGRLKDQYPSVTIIESTTTNGFSENHNLALRQAKGDYIVVLNDDTYIIDDVFTKMVTTMKTRKEIGFLSPVLLYPDGRLQLKGRSKFSFYSWLLYEAKLGKLLEFYTGVNGSDLFVSFGISGACFMARKADMIELGLFDERFFFTPEDVALGEKGMAKGLLCYVKADAIVYHINASSSAAIYGAIIPVGKQGVYILMNDLYGLTGEYAARIFSGTIAAIKYLYWRINASSERSSTMATANRNVVRFSMRRIPPKRLFIKLMAEISAK